MGMNNFTGGGNGTGNNGNAGGNIGGFPFPTSQTPAQTSGDATEYLINYNERFKTAGNAMFRDAIVSQTMAVLIGKNKPNALLVGSAGVGKTKIVEDIAYRIESRDPSVPDKLAGYTVWELPLSNIVSGSSYVGQLEEKLKCVIEFACDSANKVILFIDEIHQLVGESSVYGKIAQILKPALARGDIKVIGATTLQESSQLMDDPALNRRFSRLIVDELTQEQTVEVLRCALPGYFAHYGNCISVNQDMLPTIVAIADQYASAGNHRPDTALTLFDRACGDAVIARKQKEIALANDPTLLAALKQNPLIPITEKQVRTTAMHLMTGNAAHESLDVDSLRARFERIKGQDDILATITDRLKRNDSNLFPRKRPLTFLFAGASGVGKTEVTKIIAEEMTGVKPITLNMAEYHSPASINRIIGAPAGYVGSDSHAELPFDALESNPYQVILLDEFEKADRSVQRLFMNAFDEGSIKTSKGRNVDFSKAIIIATTNASHTTGATHSLGFVSTGDSKANVHRNTVDTLANWFDTELLNRFTMILTFHELSRDVYRDIVADIYRREIARIKHEYRSVKLADELDDDTLDAIVDETYVPKFGARPAGRAVQDYIESNAI